MESLALSFRICLGLVFLTAGVLKLQDRVAFDEAVRDYRLLPPRIAWTVATILPPAEVLAGLALLLGLATRWVAAGTLAALCAFAVGVAVNLGRGRRIDCGCLGVGSNRTIGWPLLVRDGALMAMAVVLAVRPPSAPALGGRASVLPSVAVALATVVSLLILVLLGEARRVDRTIGAIRAVDATEVRT